MELQEPRAALEARVQPKAAWVASRRSAEAAEDLRRLAVSQRGRADRKEPLRGEELDPSRVAAGESCRAAVSEADKAADWELRRVAAVDLV